ncbi:MAG: hypothetical protein AB8B51_10525 [Sedimentitalea sp.]
MARETTANAFFAYSTNYLIDTDHSIIVDVEASRSNKTAEVGAMRKMTAVRGAIQHQAELDRCGHRIWVRRQFGLAEAAT